MNKKCLLLLIIILGLLVSGCTNKYTIVFNGDNISEEIVSTIPDSYIPKLTEDDIKLGIDLDDEVTPFIKGDQHPFFDNEEIKYDKNVQKQGDKYVITLKYDYKYDDFNRSQTLKKCFDKASVSEDDKYYYFNASGKFYCLYSDEIKVNFKTDMPVDDSNAEKINDNTYSWTIKEDNSNNVDIYIKVSKGIVEQKKRISQYILIVFGLIILVTAIFFYLKFQSRQKVNDM